MLLYLKNLFLETWKKTNTESIEFINKQKGLNPNVIIILIYTSICLACTNYMGNIYLYTEYLNNHSLYFKTNIYPILINPNTQIFIYLIFWVFILILFYILIPVILIKYIFKEKLSNYGIYFKNLKKDSSLYFYMLLFMIPLVFIVSTNKSFQLVYPFFKPPKGQLMPLFFYWEIAYFINFIAVEFFFRGFMLHGLKNQFGVYSIFIMVIPYCCIHFHKPFAEAMASIIAGIILGTLSLKSKSIFWGVVIHFSVAICMDLMALWQAGYF